MKRKVLFKEEVQTTEIATYKSNAVDISQNRYPTQLSAAEKLEFEHFKLCMQSEIRQEQCLLKLKACFDTNSAGLDSLAKEGSDVDQSTVSSMTEFFESLFDIKIDTFSDSASEPDCSCRNGKE